MNLAILPPKFVTQALPYNTIHITIIITYNVYALKNWHYNITILKHGNVYNI